MFGPSLKSVPGCLVSIVPILIGEPVAFTPGLGPQDDVSVEPPELDELELEAPEPALFAAAVLLELLLLPHPARITTAMIAASATDSRVRGTY
jgi:hypothetical protein